MTRDCSNCGEEIAAKRLAAIPDAIRCLRCASRRDLSPIEKFGQAQLEKVMAIGGDSDNAQFRVGGDSSPW